MTWVRCAVLLCAALFASNGFSQASKPAPSSVPDFDVEGIGFTMCQCTAYGCPCRSNGHPTHGSCQAADFAFIRHGRFGNVRLDGVKALVVGDLIDVDPAQTGAVVYFDEKTTPAQREAFTQMFQYMFQFSAPKIAKVKVVPIRFAEHAKAAAGTVYTLEIPGVLEEKALMHRDNSGKPASTLPAMDQWGNSIHYADNLVFKYHDKELGTSWDLSGRQSNVKYFHTTKAMYEKKELLIQHGDMSGSWTAEQRAMIQKMGMKPE